VAVVPAGYRNRFGHPAADVLDRYADAGVALRRTDLEGAVAVRFRDKGPEIESERRRRGRYWHDAPR
jgi:competence protein ComEC